MKKGALRGAFFHAVLQKVVNERQLVLEAAGRGL